MPKDTISPRRVWLALLGMTGALAVSSASAYAAPDPEFLVNRASKLALAGDNDGALRDLDEAIRLSPNLAGAYSNRGVIYLQKHDYPRAILDFDAALGLDPTLASAFNNRGNAYNELGQHETAITNYGQALRLRPIYPLALINRAMAYMALGQLDQALRDVDHSYRLKTEPLALRVRGQILDKQGDSTGAIQAYTRAIQLLGTYGEVYGLRADVYSSLGQLEAALADYDKALSLGREDPINLNNRCWVRALMGRDLPLALQDCDRAISLEDSAPARATRAFVHLRMGSMDLALADTEGGLRLDSKNADSLFLRGAVRHELGLGAEAKADTDAAMAINPAVGKPYFDAGVAVWANPS